MWGATRLGCWMFTWSWKHGPWQIIPPMGFKGKVREAGSLGQDQQRRWKSGTLLRARITVGAVGTWHWQQSRLMGSPVGRSECVGSHMPLNGAPYTSSTLHPIVPPDAAWRDHVDHRFVPSHAASPPFDSFKVISVPVLDKEMKIDQSSSLFI